jgi:hypothetical protein
MDPTIRKSNTKRFRESSVEEFIRLAIRIPVPTIVANEPTNNSMCGGVAKVTSKP